MNKMLITLAFCMYLTVSCITQSCQAKQGSDEYIILSLAQQDISPYSAKVGDKFNVKTIDSLNSEGVVMSAGTILEGTVTKVVKPRCVSTDAEIKIDIEKAVVPNGKDYEFAQSKPEIVIMNPLAYRGMEKVARRAPAAVAGTATSISLATASSLSGGVIYPIAVGASFAVGLIQGAIFPEKGYTRVMSSLHRGYRSTPIGTIHTVVSKGKSFDVKEGDAVSVVFDKDDLREAKAISKTKSLALHLEKIFLVWKWPKMIHKNLIA